MHSSSKPALDLPPPFRLVTLREVGDAFAHAMRVAPEEGAGTLVHVGRFDLAELAVVLEPDEPLRSARRALYAGLAALGDALAAHAPPERPMTFDWPDAVRIDGALVGGGRLGWPRRANEDEPPDWLVFAAMIRTVAMGEGEPGVRPLSSALDEEGFDDLDSGRLVESFSRHFMAALDAWQAHGFDEVAKSYLARLAPARGVRSEIAENGDLLVRPMNVKNMNVKNMNVKNMNVKNMGEKNLERRSLLAALRRPSWLDPATGGPRV